MNELLNLKVEISHLDLKENTISNLLTSANKVQEEIERLNNIIKNLDKMFEYYFLGNLKYDQDTVNTIYIKYVQLKELKEGEEWIKKV